MTLFTNFLNITSCFTTVKTIGLIGGTTWHSTADYYRLINQTVNERLGGIHSGKLLLYSVDFEEFKPTETTDWSDIGRRLQSIAERLEQAGAECLVLCANTPHMVAGQITGRLNIPLIHIARETGKAIQQKNLRRVGLLGTKMTMEHPYFVEKLKGAGIDGIVPSHEEREYIHRTIMTEFAFGSFTTETKNGYLDIIRRLERECGIEGIIFGCTEIPMLIKEHESPLPVFDTVRIHVKAAVDFALKD